MLMSAGLSIPTRVFGHGFLTKVKYEKFPLMVFHQKSLRTVLKGEDEIAVPTD